MPGHLPGGALPGAFSYRGFAVVLDLWFWDGLEEHFDDVVGGQAFCVGVEVGEDAVSHDGSCHGPDVVA